MRSIPWFFSRFYADIKICTMIGSCKMRFRVMQRQCLICSLGFLSCSSSCASDEGWKRKEMITVLDPARELDVYFGEKREMKNEISKGSITWCFQITHVDSFMYFFGRFSLLFPYDCHFVIHGAHSPQRNDSDESRWIRVLCLSSNAVQFAKKRSNSHCFLQILNQ